MGLGGFLEPPEGAKMFWSAPQLQISLEVEQRALAPSFRAASGVGNLDKNRGETPKHQNLPCWQSVFPV